MNILLFCISLISALSCFNERTKTLNAEGFHLEWTHEGDHVHFSLTAPTSGWVAIGFTEGSEITNSNLIQGCVVGDRVVVQDQFVTGFGEHPPVEALAVDSCISNEEGIQENGKTTISFSMITEKRDKLHYDLTEGKKINVWLAYSVSDDFEHHSRKRILRRIVL